MAQDGWKVELYVYDLSQGLARQLSSQFLGSVIEAIWHTGVGVYGKEYYFGGGIQSVPLKQSPYGTPLQVLQLGFTQVPQDIFEEYLLDIQSRYTQETYNLLKHNCNNFSDEICHFLVGSGIPEHILRLPEDVVRSPIGPLLRPLIDNLESTLRIGGIPSAPSQAASSPVIPNSANFRVPTSLPSPALVSPAGHDLNHARAKVTQEITQEFALIMASGSLRASEAAALAARRVLERHRIGSVASSHPQNAT